MKQSEKLTAMFDFFYNSLPSLLAAAGLDPLDGFIKGDDGEIDAEKTLLFVDLAEGGKGYDQKEDTFTIHLQLYKKNNYIDYHDIIYALLDLTSITVGTPPDDVTKAGFDPSIVGGQDYQLDYDIHKRGEIGGGLSTTNLYYDVRIVGYLTRCR